MTVARNYDVQAAIDTLFPGIVFQSPLWRAAWDRANAKSAPLDSDDVTGILVAANVINAAQVRADYVPTTMESYPTTLPAYPTGLPRFADSNPDPRGWSIEVGGKVVNP